MVKKSPARTGDARDTGLIPGLGRPPGRRNGNSLQCSCLLNPMNIGAWWTTVHAASESQTCLSTRAHTHTHTQWKITKYPLFKKQNFLGKIIGKNRTKAKK